MKSSKINIVYNRDVKVDTSTVMVVEVGELRFEMDERFPWINVFINDNTDLGYSLIDEIEEIEPIMNHEDLAAVAMNYYFKNVKVVTERQMKELTSKEQEIKTAQVGMNELSNLSIKELVEGLKNREGVEFQEIDPYQDEKIEVNGPCLILTIID